MQMAHEDPKLTRPGWVLQIQVPPYTSTSARRSGSAPTVPHERTAEQHIAFLKHLQCHRPHGQLQQKVREQSAVKRGLLLADQVTAVPGGCRIDRPGSGLSFPRH